MHSCAAWWTHHSSPLATSFFCFSTVFKHNLFVPPFAWIHSPILFLIPICAYLLPYGHHHIICSYPIRDRAHRPLLISHLTLVGASFCVSPFLSLLLHRLVMARSSTFKSSIFFISHHTGSTHHVQKRLTLAPSPLNSPLLSPFTVACIFTCSLLSRTLLIWVGNLTAKNRLFSFCVRFHHLHVSPHVLHLPLLVTTLRHV